MDIARLKLIPLFEDIDDEALRAIGPFIAERSVSAGETIVEEGDYSFNEFFVIEEGTVEVLRAGEKLAELSAGDFFGETAVVQKEKRGATVKAVTGVRLLMLTGFDLKRLRRISPESMDKVQAKIVERTPA